MKRDGARMRGDRDSQRVGVVMLNVKATRGMGSGAIYVGAG